MARLVSTVADRMLWRADEHEGLTERQWDERRARASIGEIVADAEAACADDFWPGNQLGGPADVPGLCSLYIGSGGMLWALAELGSSIDTRAMLAVVLERYRASPDLAWRRMPRVCGWVRPDFSSSRPESDPRSRIVSVYVIW